MPSFGKIIWFTGLSGSGKTTLALALKNKLKSLDKTCEILDGDAVRNTLHKHLGFNREDIRENNRLLAKLALEESKKHDFILVSAISPFREDRAMAKNLIGENFIELFVDCPLKKCIERDVKGLYKKALAGEIRNFIGISPTNPYEPPQTSHLHLKTDTTSAKECIDEILDYLGLL